MVVRTLSAEELARDVEGLAADDDDLLAVEELLGDDAGQAAKQVALAIDHDLRRAPSAFLHFPNIAPFRVCRRHVPPAIAVSRSIVCVREIASGCHPLQACRCVNSRG